jgi:hypothetical protein
MGKSILDNDFLAHESLEWAIESGQDLVPLLLNFEKTFYKIEWGFLFPTLSKLGFNPKWIKWVSTLYRLAFSSIKVNEKTRVDFKLSRLIRQACPLAPYLFFLATNIMGHMLDDSKHKVEGLTLPKGDCVRDQTFTDDTTLYLKGTQSNLDNAPSVLDLFCLALRAKINWGKYVAIWASQGKREWELGQEVGLKWIPENENVRYLGIQVGFRLPVEANFDKLMTSLKGKMTAWGSYNVSFTGRILVTNQVLFSSMWCMVACWNHNTKMCNQIKGVIRNFIWGGRASKAWAKVKWDSLTLPLSNGGLGIIDPKV